MKRFLILALCAGATACGGNKNGYDASGTFEATEVIVSSEANGRITSFGVEEGRRLAAGQTVGTVDSVQLYLKKLQLQKQLGATRSRTSDIGKQIAATQQQIATQQREKRRVENLLKADAANTKQLDDIDAQIAVLEKQLAAQLSTLENSNRGVNEESSAIEIQVAQIEDQLAKCRIVNPIDGTVLVKLRAYITSGQLTGLKLGDKVRVFADSGDKGSREYDGEVIWISDKAEFTPKTIQTRDERANLVYPVKIAVHNDGLLKIGMYADVKFSE